MIAQVSSVALVGMDARPVEVEVDMAGGVPDFQIVGLPSTAVREARQRVRSAVINSDSIWPQRKITASLAPGDLRKEGALLDLALAMGVLLASGQVKKDLISRYLFLGELALDGRLRPVKGVLAAAIAARDAGAEGIVVPSANAMEASLVPGIRVVGVAHLAEALAFAGGELHPEAEFPAIERLLEEGRNGGPDLAEVKGQALARRAIEIAAAGGHNLLMVGPPGSGKTMLARRLPGILPPLTVEEALEVTHIWSVAGLLPPGKPVVATRPFRSPHHHASPAAMIGGGSPVPRPGEISLAHLGVLFLDEIPLFARSVLEALRQPVEDGSVIVARQGAAVRFPSQVCLVAAANPCFCGHLGDRRAVCICRPGRLEAYRSRLSGPLLDRFDLFAEVPRLVEAELMQIEPSEPSASVRARVIEARRRRGEREKACDDPREGVHLGPDVSGFLRGALTRELASARAFDRILRVARTIADLEGSEEIAEAHVAEALQFRRTIWEA